MGNNRKPKVTRHAVDDEVARLATYVRRMERRYECSSAFAELAITNGSLKETAEINSWLTTYRVLTKLSAASAAGSATGTRMNAIR